MTRGGGRVRRRLRRSAMMPARAHRRAERRPHVGPRAAGIGDEAPRRHFHVGEAHALDRRFGARQLVERHLLEIHAAQQLAVGEGHRGVELDLLLALVVLVAVAVAGVHRLGEAADHLLAVARARRLELRQEQRHHLLEELRIAPEDVEGLVEDLALVALVDEDGVQRPVEILPVGDPDRLHRLDRGEQLAGADRQPGGAQRAREIHQIGKKMPLSARLLRHSASRNSVSAALYSRFGTREASRMARSGISMPALIVMTGLDPVIHALQRQASKTWMPGSSPGMTILGG